MSKISVRSLTRKRSSPMLDYGEGWLRLTCNIPARSSMPKPEAPPSHKTVTLKKLRADGKLPIGRKYEWTYTSKMEPGQAEYRARKALARDFPAEKKENWVVVTP